MLVNRLELQGFKSFANRTVMEFKPGVMAIVGPNGCGKTNLVDAIRWVMGEQRTSLLRTEKMESVIFNGTARRKPLGFAEVTLTFYNSDGFGSLPYSEIAITRRLFRTGESEYLINRQPTRLRDVQSFLSEIGLGRHSSSIIELAMVEGILYGPREGRRALLEEVAGIAHYHNRIAEASKRLDNSRSQLQRLEDLLGEIEKNYQTLKRQASRAEKALQFQTALNDRLLYDLGQTRLEIESQIEEAHKQIYSLTESKNALEKRIDALSEKEHRQGSQIYEWEKQWEECFRELSRWERSRSDLEKDLALSQQRADHLHSQKQEKEAKLHQISHQLTSAQTTYQSLSEEIHHLNQSLSQYLTHLRKIDSLYKNKVQELTAVRNASESDRVKLQQFRQQIENRRSDALRRKVQEERLVAQWESAQSQLKELHSSKARYEEIEKQLHKQREELKVLISQKEQDVSSEEAHLKSLKDEFQNVSKQLSIAVVKGEEAQARLNSHLSS
ncbi:MAG: AAA family ATPase, partial [bacterium]